MICVFYEYIFAGDWTEALAKTLKADESEFQESYTLPTVAVDGPFGTASEDWDQYEVIRYNNKVIHQCVCTN